MMSSSFAMMSPLENEFNARLDQTAIGFGVAFSALMVSRLLLQTPLGRLSDRIGRKPLVVGGLLLLVPATALMGYVSTTLQLVGARILQGSASAGVAAPAFALAADLSSAGTEGRQMSFITAGFSLGIAVGPLIAGFLAGISFPLPFLIGAGGCLVGAALVQAVVPEPQREPVEA
jgi:MFS family permease